MDTLKSSLVSVLIPLTGMFLVALSGVFDGVELDLGLEHYAEPAWLPLVPVMPLNSLINIGYIGLGLYWCGMTERATQQGLLKDKDSILFYSLNIMSMLYGCIQLLRIVTQRTLWAVLDQWCTLPFFALLLVWGLYYRYGWSNMRTFIIMCMSISSYSLSLHYKIGFEIALGIHIIAATSGALMAYREHPADECITSFFLALLSCCGFVALKLLDHKLMELSFIFSYISGHFLSKICDIYQIYFVNNFFFDLTLQKEADISVVQKARFVEHCEKNGYFDVNDIRYEFNEFPSRTKDT